MRLDILSKGELGYVSWELSPKFKELVVVPISDVHMGNPLFSLKHFNYTIDFIKEHESAYTMLNGDMIEAITRTSIGDIFSQEDTPQVQAHKIAELLMPIKDKILGMTTGNHEERIYKATGVDMSLEISDRLGVPYNPDGLIIKLSFGSGNSHNPNKPYVFKHYMTHGYGGARTTGAKVAKIERIMAWLSEPMDWITMSHDHTVDAHPKVMLGMDERSHDVKINGESVPFKVGKVSAKRCVLVKSNAYLKWGGYAEMGGFPPSDMTAPVVRLLTPHSPHWGEIPGKHVQTVKVEV